MFLGVSNINLDAKGRLAMPTRYRDFLTQHCNGEMVITLDLFDKCLLIYPRPAWNDLEREIIALPNFDPRARQVQRIMLGHASEVQMDSNGRVQVSQPLREIIGLDKKAVFSGQGKKFELWDEETYRNSRETWKVDPASVADLPPEVTALSI
ncbi:MAG: division/cell wall cluster transcriptional repressor MraZ [Pseudomonadales bacterium]|nr:division/cell wall cluster transcriptional repressor MraZ [Pseudomonadales bacterium]